jgi:DNA (cytosine-5)-methyltransferase 1
MFPDNHTIEASDVKRAFLMGNALVTGVVKKIGTSLLAIEFAVNPAAEDAL